VGQSALETHRDITVLDGAGHETSGGASVARALAGETLTGVSEVEGTYLENVLTPIRSAGEIKGVVGVSLVVSEQKRLEEQLRQSQKMEAIGRFAAGIAHDFNNILTGISGYADLLLEDLHTEDPRRDDVQEIQQATLRAAGLTRQLLAFSRKQVLQPKVLSLAAVVENLLPLLRRIIGEDVVLAAQSDPDLGVISADPGQLEQVLLNLVVNSRDAMPEGGELTITTCNVDVEEPSSHGKCIVPPGRYALLAVHDTGTGMTAAVQARIFEPFFTTKPQGKGTGLGLSTVYGIVKQSGGYIAVASEPNCGTTLSVYFPRVESPITLSATSSARESPRGTETILVVEDQDMVRALTGRVLEGSGYRILSAANGKDALEVASAYTGHIDMMVSDVIMPGMSGRELGLLLHAARPDMKVLFLSGYPDESIVRHGVLEPGVAFLQKPFAPDVLVQRVREELDGTNPSGQ
jgi:signal transduction histidine kinase/ActR/RegA family two-component response regulator